MTILYLDHAPIWGGAEAMLVNLLAHLDRSRFGPVVGTSAGSLLVRPLEQIGVSWRPLVFDPLNGVGAALPRNLVRTVYRIVRLVRREDADLIHTNTVRAHIGGALAGVLTGVPVVWTLHDNTFPPRIYRLLAPIPRRIVTVSNWLGDLYGPLGGSASMQVIPNGLVLSKPKDPTVDVRGELGIAEDALLVVSIGRLIESKAPHLLLEAAPSILKTVPHVHFVIVGGPDEDVPTSAAYAQWLSRLVEEMELTERIHLTGHRMDVDAFYAAADLVVYAAVEPEGLPTVLLEAMAHRTSVVASAIGGALEIVADGETGRLFPPGDVRALATAISELLGRTDLRHQFGANGRRRLEESFSIQRQTERMEALYAELLRS